MTSPLVQEMQQDPFLRPDEIAKELKVSISTVVSWARKGKFGKEPKVIRTPGGATLIRKSAYVEALKAAIEDHKTESRRREAWATLLTS